MPLILSQIPLLSPDEYSPFANGLLKMQEAQRNAATLPYAGKQAQADLLKSLLENQLSQQKNPITVQEAQQDLIKSQISTQRARNQLGLFNQASQGLGINNGSQVSLPANSSNLNQNDVAAIQSNQTGALPYSKSQTENLRKRLQELGPNTNQTIPAQESGDVDVVGGQDMNNGATPKQLANMDLSSNESENVSPKQQNEKKISDLQRQAQLWSLAGNKEMADTLLRITDQYRHGTIQQQKQAEFDVKRLTDFGDESKQAKSVNVFMDDMRRRLEKLPETLFYPGIRKSYSANANSEFQTLINDSKAVATTLPNIFGVPAKGLNVKFEQDMKAMAANPTFQLKKTVINDLDRIQELSDRRILNEELARHHLSDNLNTSNFRQYGGELKGYFNSKQEFANWLHSLPPDVQSSVYRELKKKGKK